MINQEPELPPQRVFSAEQKAVIASAVKDRPPGKLVCILNGSKEANQLSRQIESVLKEQGWTVQHFSGPSSRREFDHVRVGFQPTENPAFVGLVEGLKQAGIKVSSSEFEMNSEHRVYLDVGAARCESFNLRSKRSEDAADQSGNSAGLSGFRQDPHRQNLLRFSVSNADIFDVAPHL
ncbi:MAG: hypothetical protein AAGC86_04455 [Pseudomonadota bacterium]